MRDPGRYNTCHKRIEVITMSTVDQIEAAILQLSPEDFRQLSEWLAELSLKRWDEQLERDVAAGKLDALAEEAIADFKAGRCQPL
jgi:hypothetical protein